MSDSTKSANNRKPFIVGRLPGGKIFTFLFFIYLYAPMVVLVAYSFNENRRVMNWTGFSFDWYVKAFGNENIQRAAWNSLVIAVVATAFAVVIGVARSDQPAAGGSGNRNGCRHALFFCRHRAAARHHERHHRAHGFLHSFRVFTDSGAA